MFGLIPTSFALVAPEAGRLILEISGNAIDMYAAERRQATDQYIGTLDLEQGPNNLLLKLVGKHEKSEALGLDLRNIICERVD